MYKFILLFFPSFLSLSPSLFSLSVSLSFSLSLFLLERKKETQGVSYSQCHKLITIAEFRWWLEEGTLSPPLSAV
jgi:hypothetical protein